MVESESAFPTLPSPVLVTELVKQAKAVQTGSLQAVHSLEKLQDGKVSGGSGGREWGLVEGEMMTCILPGWREDAWSDLVSRGFGHHKGVTSSPADISLPFPNLFLPTASSAASQGGPLAQDCPAVHAAEPLTSSSGERQGQSGPLLWPS